jgi:hypothetical protein
MPNINYVEILKNAWQVTWKNKFLWWFGFLIALSSGGGGFNYSPDEKEKSKVEDFINSGYHDFISAYWHWIVAGIIIILVLSIIFIILGLIGRGALIKSTDKIIRGEKTNFKEGFRKGKKYLGKIFLISLTLGIFLLISVIILVAPIAILFASKAYVAGTLLTIIGIVTIIPIIILFSFLKTYGYIYAVLGDLKTWAAIESAYALFRKNILSSIIMALIFIPISLAVMFGALMIVVPSAIIFLLLGIGLYALFSKIGIAITIGLAIFALIIAVLFVKSVYEAFTQTAWILFFREIAAPKIEEKIPEPLGEIVKEDLPKVEVIKTAENKK